MIRHFLILSLIINLNLYSQDWDFSLTDCNMTVLVEYENVTFNSTIPPIGSLIGAFYVNDDGAFSCAGYSTFTEDQFAVSIWGSESGLDNGFSSGENITWFIQVDGESFQASNSIMLDENMFSSTYQCNGFGQVNSLSFFSSGCSDISACNYCESCIEFDDSLCDFPQLYYDCIGECLNDIDNDNVCDEIEIEGCTDPLAPNFSEQATNDDGSCEYVILGCTNSIAANYNPQATNDDDSCLYCNDINADNYYDGTDGSFCVEDLYNNYSLEIGPDGFADCCFYPNPGCTDDGSCYDSDGDGDLDECDDKFLYQTESGELAYYESPFPGIAASNYNPTANVLVGINYCYYFPACQDQSALNYGFNCSGEDILSLALSNGFSIDFNQEPETNPFTISFNGNVLNFENSESCCLYYGCDDPSADNYFDIDGIFYENIPESSVGSSNYGLDGTYSILDPDLPDWVNLVSLISPNDIDGDGILNNIDSDPDGDGFNIVYNFFNIEDTDIYSPCIYLGCTDGGLTENGDDIVAYNYDPFANVDDGSCQYYVCDDPNSMNYVQQSDLTVNQTYCTEDFYDNQIFVPVPDGLNDCCKYLGCTDENSVNYNPNATIDELVFNYTPNSEYNYSPVTVTDSDGVITGYQTTCYPYIYGCIDPIAENFNDYDLDGQSNSIIEDNNVFRLIDIDIFEVDQGLFGINSSDEVVPFNLSGNLTNVNSYPPIELNSVNPCEYVYGCMNPCYIEYYDVVNYDIETQINFNSINNLLTDNGCEFIYNYGCSELSIPNPATTFDDGSCTNLLVYGCMDPDSENFNPDANISDCESCINELLVDFEITQPQCFDDNFGKFYFEVSGGIPPYQVIIYNSEGNIEQNISLSPTEDFNEIDLGIDEYFVEVFDSSNNITNVSFSIIEGNEFVIDLWESGGWLTTEPGYDSYEWTLDGDILNSLDEYTFQINPTISGTYGVTAFYEYNGDLCISNTAYENFAIIQTSLQDADDINFSYYQIDNNFLVIDFESDKENNINVDMFDSFGKVVYNNKATPVNQYIPINELVNGVYYIRLIINNKFVSTKSIIIN